MLWLRTAAGKGGASVTPDQALKGSLRDYRVMPGTDLLARFDPFYEWQDLRRQHDLWPYAKSTATAPKTRCTTLTDSGKAYSGVNFASQDYLSLASHPEVKRAAIDAIEEYGVHSAGSAALLGNTKHSLQLERVISEFLNGREIVLYPTGWSAGFAAVQGFVRPDDHVVMDVLAHSCLQEGARAATQNIHYHGHLNIPGLERRLSKIRAKDTTNGILVVTESLFSMHSDTPDIRALRAACDKYDAMLLVDCAHDLGCIGDDGLGHLGLQNMLDEVDIVVGSFSKTFAANGGFIARQDQGCRGVLEVLQRDADVLECALAGAGRLRACRLQHRSLRGRQSAPPAAHEQHPLPAQRSGQGGHGAPWRSIRHRAGAGRRGRAWPASPRATSPTSAPSPISSNTRRFRRAARASACRSWPTTSSRRSTFWSGPCSRRCARPTWSSGCIAKWNVRKHMAR